MLTRVFIIGPTGAGKSTLARALGEKLGARVVSAGGWARAAFPSKQREELATSAVAKLREDPDVAIRWIEERGGLEDGYQVVEGVRNPRDFALLCSPRRDALIFLDAPLAGPASSWEADSLGALIGLVRFYQDTWKLRVRGLSRETSGYFEHYRPVALGDLTAWVLDAPHA